MKKILITATTAFLFSFCQAQTRKDTVMVDSTQVERIHKMPMDTTHHTMPIVPLTPGENKKYRETGDDADPKMPKSPEGPK